MGCVLTHGTAVNGHDLAAAPEVTVSARPSGERRLDTGTLAHDELLFDVRWPAGTVLHGTAASPDQLAHARASPGEEVSFCTPEGQDVPVPGVVLHGKIGYEVPERGRVLEYCDENDRPNDRGGYATVGADQHSRGSQADPTAPWTWNDYKDP